MSAVGFSDGAKSNDMALDDGEAPALESISTVAKVFGAQGSVSASGVVEELSPAELALVQATSTSGDIDPNKAGKMKLVDLYDAHVAQNGVRIANDAAADRDGTPDARVEARLEPAEETREHPALTG